MPFFHVQPSSCIAFFIPNSPRLRTNLTCKKYKSPNRLNCRFFIHFLLFAEKGNDWQDLFSLQFDFYFTEKKPILQEQNLVKRDAGNQLFFYTKKNHWATLECFSIWRLWYFLAHRIFYSLRRWRRKTKLIYRPD